jgi:HAD superfamily hydrolase (TIGR01549 family)
MDMDVYKVVFFDLDHTLVDTRRQYDIGLARTIEILHQGDVPEDFVDRFMHHHGLLWKEYDRRDVTMETLRRERYIRAWRDYGVAKDIVDADQFQGVYDSIFDETLFTYPGTTSMLEALRRKYRLGVVTNGSPDLQWRKMRATGLDRFIQEEHLIISGNIGHAKPHPTVYEAACKALDVSPTAAIMVGDSWPADVAGARAFGIDAVWYVPDEEMAAAAVAADGDNPIQRAEEVVDRIEKMEQARLV